jgi:hypothetical protein
LIFSSAPGSRSLQAAVAQLGVSVGHIVRKPILIATQILLLLGIGLLLFSILYRPKHVHQTAIASTCLQNLRTIAEAKEEWAKEQHRGNTDTPAWSDIVTTHRSLKVRPECPGGGTYSIGSLGEHPRCTIPGHILP